jgi:hypothetical protein
MVIRSISKIYILKKREAEIIVQYNCLSAD